MPSDSRISSQRFWEFIPAIGGTAEDVPEKFSPGEEIDAAVLNVLGRQGWELVACVRDDLGGDKRLTCYLKRPKTR